MPTGMYRMMPVLPTYKMGGGGIGVPRPFRICNKHVHRDYVHCLVHHLKEDSRIAAGNCGGGVGHRFGPAGTHTHCCIRGICCEYCHLLHQ